MWFATLVYGRFLLLLYWFCDISFAYGGWLIVLCTFTRYGMSFGDFFMVYFSCGALRF